MLRSAYTTLVLVSEHATKAVTAASAAGADPSESLSIFMESLYLEQSRREPVSCRLRVRGVESGVKAL